MSYRLPLLLCAVEGLSREEAARRLNWPIGSVKGRLERGRELLRTRLAARGLTVPAVLAGGLVASPTEAMPTALAAVVTRAAVMMPAASGFARTVLAALTFVGLGVGVGVAVWPSPVSDAPPAPVAADPQPRVDIVGDPLPNGAVARLGSTRLRPGDWTYGLAYSPDSRRLACWTATFSQSGTLTVWDTTDGRELRRVFLPAAQMMCFRWLADGRGVALLRLAPGEYYFWNFADENAPPPPPIPNAQLNSFRLGDLLAIAMSPDGKWLATGHTAQTDEPTPIKVFELAVNCPLSDLKSRVLGKQPGHGYQTAFSPDSRTVVALSRAQEPNQEGAPAAGFGPAFSPLIMGKLADKARLVAYDVVTRQERIAFDIPAAAGGVMPTSYPLGRQVIAFTPNGRSLITGHPDGTVRLWEMATGREQRSWMAHPPLDPNLPRYAGVGGLVVSGEHALLTSGSFGGLQKWDLNTGRGTWAAANNRVSFNTFAVSPDGSSVASGDASGAIHLRDCATGAERSPAPGHTHWVEQLLVSPDGRTALTASSDCTAREWDLVTGRQQRQVTLAGRGWTTAFTPGGRELIGSSIWVSGGGPTTPQYDKFVWDVATGKRQPITGELADPKLWFLSGPSHGALLVVDHRDESVSLRDWPSGLVRQTFPPPVTEPPITGYQTNTAAISADGHLVAVVGNDRRTEQTDHGWVSVFDAVTARVNYSWSTPDVHPGCIAFSPDGSGIVVGGRTWVPSTPVAEPRPWHKSDAALVLLDSQGGEVLRTFMSGKVGENGYRNISAVAVSPDGRQLAAAERDFSIWLYEVATGKIRRHFTGHSNEVTALAFTPDGQRLVSTSRDLTGLVWNVSLAAGRPGPSPTAAHFAQLWADLASPDWELAGPALATLAVYPEATIGLLLEHLKPATRADGADPAALATLIKQLDAEALADSERAMTALRRHGSDALPAVKERLRQDTTAELKKRLTNLVIDISAFSTPADRLREIRAVEVLEQIATPAAREHLKSLSNGAPGATLTRAAADALKRLPK